MKQIKIYLHSINFQGLSFDEIIDLLISKNIYDSEQHSDTSIKRVLNEVQRGKRTIPIYKFGSCGIDSDANPCGDADEY